MRIVDTTVFVYGGFKPHAEAGPGYAVPLSGSPLDCRIALLNKRPTVVGFANEADVAVAYRNGMPVDDKNGMPVDDNLSPEQRLARIRDAGISEVVYVGKTKPN